MSLLTRQCEISYLRFIYPHWKPGLCRGTTSSLIWLAVCTHLTPGCETDARPLLVCFENWHCSMAPCQQHGNTPLLTGGEMVQVEQTFYSRLQSSYLWHLQPLKLCWHCVLHKYFDWTANFRIWGWSSKTHPATTLWKFTLHWERSGTFTSFCYPNSLMFWVMGKVYFAFSKNLMKLTQSQWRECGQCRLIWTLFMQVLGMKS